MDYILGTDQSIFRNVSVRDPQHNTDHFMVVGYLSSAPAREHTNYLTGRKKLPLQPLTTSTREDRIFAALRRAIPKPHTMEQRTNKWISEETCRLVNERVSARQGKRVKARIWRLSREIAASLKGYRRRRVEISGEEVETLLGADPLIPKEGRRRLKGWYKATVNCAPPPA